MWVEVRAPLPLSFPHTDHIVLFTSHIAGFGVSFEVGTLEGGPEVRDGWELVLSQTLG